MALMVLTSVLVALGAGTRSAWSPCGLSMLTSINPISERGRQHRYGVTSAWFITGAVLGGMTLGLATAVLAQGVKAAGIGLNVRFMLGASLALLTLLLDLGLLGVKLPVIRRQVNERWLDEFRGWFYGVGFGWQIGVGVATYVMTAAVGLLVILAALTAQPGTAMAICVLFGLIRGSWVLLTARVRTPEGLRQMLSRLDQLEEPVRRVVLVLELGAGTLLAAGVAGWMSAVMLGAGLVLLAQQLIWRPRISRPAP